MNIEHGCYIAWDGDDVLYVGRTQTFETRMRQHKLHSQWYELHTRIDWVPCENFDQSCSMEAELITDLNPLFNRALVTGRPVTRHEGFKMEFSDRKIVDVTEEYKNYLLSLYEED